MLLVVRHVIPLKQGPSPSLKFTKASLQSLSLTPSNGVADVRGYSQLFYEC